MTENQLNIKTTVAISKPQFNEMLGILKGEGYQTIGPVIRKDSLAYDKVDNLSDFPFGYETDQEAGKYRIHKNGGHEYFQATPGVASWKRFLTPPRKTLINLENDGSGWKDTTVRGSLPKYAFVGVRSCELEAIKIQDNVLLRDDYEDMHYKKIREQLLIIVANCLHPASTCFCTSMDAGPEAVEGYDLKITEFEDIFLVDIGSEKGIELIEKLDYSHASPLSLQTEKEMLAEAKAKIVGGIENKEYLRDLLNENLSHPAWDELGKKCLSCGSCTAVCPTCFCWDVQDITNLHASSTKREKVWDSCFNPSFTSHAGGGSSRPTTSSRLRQRLTHKFANWVTQHGSEGCVGCGRCITWCPAKDAPY